MLADFQPEDYVDFPESFVFGIKQYHIQDAITNGDPLEIAFKDCDIFESPHDIENDMEQFSFVSKHKSMNFFFWLTIENKLLYRLVDFTMKKTMQPVVVEVSVDSYEAICADKSIGAPPHVSAMGRIDVYQPGNTLLER